MLTWVYENTVEKLRGILSKVVHVDHVPMSACTRSSVYIAVSLFMLPAVIFEVNLFSYFKNSVLSSRVAPI